MKDTTTIIVLGERWEVPRGFGAAYRLEVFEQMRHFRAGRPSYMIDDVIDVMLLVGFAPTRSAVYEWPLRKRVEAIVYCADVALRSSGNILRPHVAIRAGGNIRPHPPLSWLPEPWCGGSSDEGRRRFPTKIES